ncbi:MAG: DUF1566 domain-containing protein [Deltaproteobacteria bacterium]|nr:DUF1566 domain-containing protein [Deltaproteobacteria bacterium]
MLPVRSQAAQSEVIPPILSLLLKQCDYNHLSLCATSSTCTGAGGYWWTNNTCNSTPEPATCDSSHLDLCATSSTCTGAGGYWWSNNTCNSTQEPPPGTCADRGLPGPETVNYSGHEWQRCDDGNTYIWDAANGYCANLSLDGHSDWRLPTKDELKSLVVCTNGTTTPLADYPGTPYYCGDGNSAPYASPTIDMQFSCQSHYYWSSSVYGEDSAWTVHFFSGYADWYYRNYNSYVRCVR